MTDRTNYVASVAIAAFTVIVMINVSFCAISVQDPVCPGHKFRCDNNQTCCQLQYGRFGCCPYPDAVCCSDKQSCCPNGYQCNITARSCVKKTKSNNPMIPIQLPQLEGASSNELTGNVTVGAGKKACPGGDQTCPDTYTCCSQVSGGYGCCPLTGAICCPDKVHCCPMGTTCNGKFGSCDG